MNTDFIIVNKGSFLEITCKEGHNITNWDKNDIKEFSSAKIMIAPTDYDLTKFYCLTDEENEKLMNEQIAAIQAEEESNNRN